MNVVCLDFESVLVPEIWISVAESMNIPELRLTTRDIADYNVLMRKRLEIINSNNIRLKDIQDVVDTLDPLEGAAEFLSWLRIRYQVIILSDTFYEFALPLLEKLSFPTIFCNSFEIGEDGFIKNYVMRQADGKKKSVQALKSLGFKVTAIGDSYNDVNMLKEANVGILFNGASSVKKDHPQLLIAASYEELKILLNDHTV